ncbi:uncharacterized protein F5891DRAFT_956275 [Suillus fuscotomentosus]|uniref:Uncharacterized protein n=1 Tax=Suillus fuscotomentosus TaxID=1912939 RepID=A0AAD4HJ30_9AGAM|nr:uncharacterized protein F5891DRAFT_956275 [Suillus fuscotomentosus]KAG1898016.1 hypothetical protein F5891DRAFT_956275 [Suillus fuscotomentosus]
MLLLSLTLFFSSWNTFVYAGSQTKGDNCTITNNRLEFGTFQFHSDCDVQTYCSSSQGTCELKGCRKDQYPFGYTPGDWVPPLCPPGQFCPDESDACQPWLPVGSACQLNRDDQCQPPPNWQQLADPSKYGRNVNGSICLNNVCMWANVTVGQSCEVENTAYIAYAGNNEFIDIVSRGNCQIGSYCDSQSLVCIQAKELWETCDADKECSSFNCLDKGVCGLGSDSPKYFKTWVYAVVGAGIFGGMFATLIALFLIHRRQRDQEREKRLQYWCEQNAFRQSIMQMKEIARTSILSLPGGTGNSNRSTVCSRAGSEESFTPMVQHSVHKSSGLRQQYLSDDNGSAYDEMMMQADHR